MILIRAIYLLLVLFFATFSMSYTLADTHDTNASAETSEEEALPLNDPFAGDESLSSGTNIISGSEEEREAMSLYKFKLVGIIEGEYEAYVTLVDASGETLSLTLPIIFITFDFPGAGLLLSTIASPTPRSLPKALDLSTPPIWEKHKLSYLTQVFF